MNKIELRSTFALSSIFGLRMLGLFMIIPVFSIYADQLPDVTPTLIGIALGIYGLTQALFQLPFGVWSDYTARRKVMLIGLMIFAIGSIVAALSHTIIGIIIGRALQGAGAIGSTTIALVGDLTTVENRSKAMGLVGITIGFAFIVGIILGPALANFIGVPGLFWVTALLAMLAIFILWRYVPTPTQHAQKFNLRLFAVQLKILIHHPALMRLNLSIFLAHAILMSFFVVAPPWIMEGFHFPATLQWQIYLPTLVLIVILIGGLMRQKHFMMQEKKWVAICIGFMVLGQGIFATLTNTETHSLSLLYLALFFFLFGFTFLEALLPSLVSQTVAMDFRGTATGLFSTCQFLGIFVGGLLGGLLMQHNSIIDVFSMNVLIGLIWYVVMVPLRGSHSGSAEHRTTKTRSERQD